MSRNLAITGTAMPSYPGYGIGGAFDDDPGTWYTSNSVGGWIEVDLGARKNIYHVALSLVPTAEHRAIECRVSVDGVVVGATNGGGCLELQTAGRVVRIEKLDDYLTTSKVSIIGNDITMPALHIVGYGNSYMAGPQGYPYLNWTAAGLRLAQYDVSLAINAVGGRTAAQMLADFDTLVPPLLRADRPNVFVFQDASNDMSLYGTSKEDAWTTIKAVWEKARPRCRVVAVTHIPRLAQSFEDNRAWLNDQIRNSSTLWDALADYGGALHLGSQGFLSDPQFYDETVHPTPLAGAIEAGIAAGAIHDAL